MDRDENMSYYVNFYFMDELVYAVAVAVVVVTRVAAAVAILKFLSRFCSLLSVDNFL